MSEAAKLSLDGKEANFGVRHGTIGPDVVDIGSLYKETGAFTYDPGFTSTASCESKITFIDGDEGILLHRGYPIEQLAEEGDFLEVCYLLLNGELPNAEQIVCWDINYNELELTTDDPRLIRTAEAPEPGFDLVLVLDVLEHLRDRLVGTTITIDAAEHRSQRRNRTAARERLADLLREALAPPPPPRRATRPTRGSQRRRLAAKLPRP